ncbi:hypothetical protein BDK51DRAFT_28362, partial [Blyttiomyces helicus]
ISISTVTASASTTTSTSTASITTTSVSTSTETATASITTTVTGTTTLTCDPTPAAYIPGPCAAIKKAHPASVDGNYVVTLPGTSKKVDVYCANFASGQPLEYVNLTASYSQNVDEYDDLVQLTFTKARVLLNNPNALYMDLLDLTFATASGFGTAPISLGEANSCSSNTIAESVIDLTGSSFTLVDTQFYPWGNLVSDSNLAVLSQCDDGLIPGAIVGPCSEFGGFGEIVEYVGPRNRLLQIAAA